MSFFMRLDTIQRETAAAASTTTTEKNHTYSAFACSESRSFSDLTFKKQVVRAYIHIIFQSSWTNKKNEYKNSHSFDACVVCFLLNAYFISPFRSHHIRWWLRKKITMTTSTMTTMMFKMSSVLESVCWLNTCMACYIGGKEPKWGKYIVFIRRKLFTSTV